MSVGLLINPRTPIQLSHFGETDLNQLFSVRGFHRSYSYEDELMSLVHGATGSLDRDELPVPINETLTLMAPLKGLSEPVAYG